MDLQPWRLVLLITIVIGHFGLCLAFYNRINGLGLPRRVLKVIELVAFCVTLLVPALAIVFHGPALNAWLQDRSNVAVLPQHLRIYAMACLASWIVFGVPWLLWRPIFGLEWTGAPRRVQQVDVQRHCGSALPLTWQCRWESRLPMNQIFALSIEEVELPVRGLPTALDGYRIAHLSDVHLTGDVHPDFSSYAVSRATAWQPDLMALTGDIIDAQKCIEWLPQIFARATARDGCYYVLGNHDTRISDARQTRGAMDRAGWTDLGSRVLTKSLVGVPTELIGNEHPWFGRPRLDRSPSDYSTQPFRLLLSHSPDQIWWARSNQVQLMLAGHTHGGQGRLPLVGPILSPSFHGSRFAAGDFYKSPTTMYVSRGLSGTHLIRIHCPPELALLTLRAVDDDST